MSKKKRNEFETAEGIESALTRTEQFIEKYQNAITIVILAIVAVVGIYLAYTNLYLKNREESARSQMYVAEQYFQQDSFRLALNGDGNYPGVLTIIDEYGLTKSANLAHYYAGISYLRLGDYNEAIAHLKDFDADDLVLSAVATGAIGDAYWEKGDPDAAAEYYMEAGKMRENEFSAPIYLLKAGMAFEEQEAYSNALDAYRIIKKQYPQSREARDIDKYIARVQEKAEES